MHRLHGDAGRTLFEQFPFDCGFRTFALADAGAAVYVDRLSDWRVALLAPGWSRVSFVWGDAATTDAGQQVIACARRHSPGQMMIISTPTTAWRDAIMAGAGPGAFVVPRVDYDAFDRDAFHAGALREPKVTFPIQPIDETWINHVRPDCDEHFEPITFRAQNGCGFVAVDTLNERVCAAASTLIVRNQSNIGIATRPNDRRQGLAAAVGRAIVNHCLAKGVRLHVCTGTTNIAARAWAEHLGFRNPIEHDWVFARAGKS